MDTFDSLRSDLGITTRHEGVNTAYTYNAPPIAAKTQPPYFEFFVVGMLFICAITGIYIAARVRRIGN